MTNENVHVPYGDSASDTATLLLAAAAEKDLPASVVEARPFDGTFLVPAEVAEQAGLDPIDPDEEFNKAVADAEAYVQDEGGALPSQAVTGEEGDTGASDSSMPGSVTDETKRGDVPEGSELPSQRVTYEGQDPANEGADLDAEVAPKPVAKKATARKTTAKKATTTKES